MNKKNDAKRKVLTTVLTVLDHHDVLWKPVLSLSKVVTRLKGYHALIDAAQRKQALATTPLQKSKAELRQDAIDGLLAVAGMLTDHAKESGLPELAREASVNKTAVGHGRQSFTLVEAERLLKVGQANAAVITAASSDPAFLAGFEQTVKDYRVALTRPRQAVIERSTATRGIRNHTLAATSQLAQLDDMMRQFRKTQPDFYEEYRQARINIEPGPTAAEKPQEPDAAPDQKAA